MRLIGGDRYRFRPESLEAYTQRCDGRRDTRSSYQISLSTASVYSIRTSTISDCGRLIYDTVLFHEWLPTFRWNLSLSSDTWN